MVVLRSTLWMGPQEVLRMGTVDVVVVSASAAATDDGVIVYHYTHTSRHTAHTQHAAQGG